MSLEERMRVVEMKQIEAETKSEARWGEQWNRNRKSESESSEQCDQVQILRETSARVDENLKAIKKILWMIAAAGVAMALERLFRS